MTARKFDPKRLRIARTFLGFSQSDLAERVGATRQFIHQLESDLRSPNDEMSAALAAALLIEKEFLFQPLQTDIAQEDCNFRRLQSSRVRDIEQVIAHGTLLSELLALIDQELHLPAPNFPKIAVQNADDVEHAAEQARAHWKLTLDRPISSAIRVAENAGAVVIKFQGVSHEIDALSIFGRRPLIIRSSEKESPTRLRFDICHEIGHLVLHRRGSRLAHEDAENQANRFSSAFLLPRKAFIKEFPRGRRLDWRAIFAIKRAWNVSAQAILRRAFDLGLIDAAQYRSGNVFIAKKGYKRNEPFEPTEAETPELIRVALVTLHKQVRALPRDIANRLAIQPVLLGKLLGVPFPDLREADARTVIDLNARLDWSKVKWNAW
jgi:Zn-dependent peptidase ImmA (M78 family)/DNA-binding XRE family transcriptional regulator